MPETRTKIARLVLVLDELLTLAEAHEKAELSRYRQLAFSFLTFDTSVSRLMASLGIQCEMRIEELQRVSRQLGLSDGLTELPTRGEQPSAAQPYFICSPDMASDVLEQAIIDAKYSLRFHQHLREATAIPALYPAMSVIIKQKQAEHAVLEGFMSSRSCLDLTMMAS
ncbi:hypothetical protein [Halomonas chromatireducens]|uniref:Uncharacterized protein n=1 Tax=Halomonas chromatireducens TaxID=507626 RepID=A0A109UKY7_9GAMM|nr:hypothetical protein [Halomonas chromatireducens]AMC99692.1 hypothetical protein LOKO_00604 [Halomonas chromatireducens]